MEVVKVKLEKCRLTWDMGYDRMEPRNIIHATDPIIIGKSFDDDV